MEVKLSSPEWQRSSSALRSVVVRLAAVNVRAAVGVHDSIGDGSGDPRD
jgi:hypothetical protein